MTNNKARKNRQNLGNQINIRQSCDFKTNCIALLSIIWHVNKMTTSLIRTQQNVLNENLSTVKESDEESQ